MYNDSEKPKWICGIPIWENQNRINTKLICMLKVVRYAEQIETKFSYLLSIWNRYSESEMYIESEKSPFSTISTNDINPLQILKFH